MFGWLRHRAREAGARVERPAEPVLLTALEPEELLGLERELEGLSSLRVPAAARERGWALVRQEVDARQTRGAFQVSRQAQPRRRVRNVLAAGLTMLALVLGSLGIHSLATLRLADNGPSVTTLAAGPVETTGPVPGTSPQIGQPSTTGTSAGMPSSSVPGGVVTTVEGPATTTAVTGQTPTTVRPVTSVTTSPSTTAGTTPITQQSTSTSRQVMTKEERETTAIGAVSYMAQAVIAGNSAGAAAQVAPSASSGLAQLVDSLHNPSGYSVEPLGEYANGDLGVVLKIEDLQPDNQGGSVPTLLRFVALVRVTPESARIVAIYSAP